MIFKILTLGCKTNQAESIEIEKSLYEAGHKIADNNDIPDVCIINTCSVTAKADQQSRQLINKYSKENIRVIVTGCYSELNFENLKSLNPQIELIRNYNKNAILKLFKENTSNCNYNYQNSRHRPPVKVQDGCNNFCSYCVIPITRGRSISISKEKIIDEIINYESSGFKEVVLTGIHLGSYGIDLKPKASLSYLLKLILKKTKQIRIRLSSLEINEIDEELLEVITETRICKHLHIPLQSGDNEILKLMNRKYRVEDYISTINKLLYYLNDIRIGTDVIVGFPHEGTEQFENTKAIVEEIPISYLHVFTFSPRPRTQAALLKNQIEEKTKKLRSEILRSISEDKKTKYIVNNIGKIKEVVVENQNSKGCIGTSGDYIKVYIENNEAIKEGMLLNVRLLSYNKGVVIGHPLI